MDEDRRSASIIFNKFMEQLEPKGNFRTEESLDDFVKRYSRLTEKCSLSENEQQGRII